MVTQRPAQRPADTARAASGINALAGLWLVASAFFFGLNDVPAALWNTFIVGAAVVVFSAARAGRPLDPPWPSWANLLLSAWLIVSPFVFGYQYTASLWNSIALGVVVGALSLISAMAVPDRSSRVP